MSKILEFCKQLRSAKEICQNFQYQSIPTLKREYLKPLVKIGILKMTIPEKPTSGNQQYITNFFKTDNNGKGDYTEERKEALKDVTIEEFEKFLAEN